MPDHSISRPERLKHIERLLLQHPGGMRVVEIADLCRVDRRTIYRDLVALEEAGVPLRQDDGRYGIIRERYQATLRLSFNEVMALFLGARLLARTLPQYSPNLYNAMNQMSRALAEPVASHVNKLAEGGERVLPGRNMARILEIVMLAWLQQQKVRLWYRMPAQEDYAQADLSIYFVEPDAQGSIYLVGRDGSTGEMRLLDIQSVKRAWLLDDAADVPDDFDPRPYLSVIEKAGEHMARA